MNSIYRRVYGAGHGTSGAGACGQWICCLPPPDTMNDHGEREHHFCVGGRRRGQGHLATFISYFFFFSSCKAGETYTSFLSPATVENLREGGSRRGSSSGGPRGGRCQGSAAQRATVASAPLAPPQAPVKCRRLFLFVFFLIRRYNMYMYNRNQPALPISQGQVRDSPPPRAPLSPLAPYAPTRYDQNRDRERGESSRSRIEHACSGAQCVCRGTAAASIHYWVVYAFSHAIRYQWSRAVPWHRQQKRF